MPDLSLSTRSLLLKMDYRQAFEFAIEHAFQGVGFWSCPCDFWPGRLLAQDLANIRARARKRGVSLAVHFW